jgi:hypothetical protein
MHKGKRYWVWDGRVVVVGSVSDVISMDAVNATLKTTSLHPDIRHH